MIARRRVPAPVTPRQRLRGRRTRALLASAAVLTAVAAVGGLLVAPGALAAVRLFGVGLGWWAAAAFYAVGLLALGLAARADDARPPETP